jgi:hypothetical protein
MDKKTFKLAILVKLVGVLVVLHDQETLFLNLKVI